MALSSDGILEAVFDPATASVRLVVDGAAWPPLVDRVNVAVNPVPQNTGGWTTQSALYPVARVTDVVHRAGTASSRATRSASSLTATAAAWQFVGSSTIGSAGRLVVDPSESYWLSVWVRTETPGRRARLTANWFTGAGGSISNVSGPLVDLEPGEWTRVTFLASAPANAERLMVQVAVTTVSGNAVGGEQTWIQDFMLGDGGVYFDGDMAPVPGVTFSWQGTPHASPSVAGYAAAGGTVDAITITRSTPSTQSETLRGLAERPVVAGSFVGSDHEAPLGSEVTYRVLGHVGGAPAWASAPVTVSTDGAAHGMWMKAPGLPSLTVRAEIAEIADAGSATLGGVYQIAGGGAVSQVAQWSGIGAERLTVSVRGLTRAQVARIRSVLEAGRVLLFQPVGADDADDDMDPGWYYVSSVSRSLLAQVAGGGGGRGFTMALTRVASPAGDGVGIAGVTWESLVEQFATWQDVVDAHATWFDVLRGT